MTAAILAGGAGKRLGGRDKGLESLAGRPLIAYVIERIRPQVDDVIIVANRHRRRIRRAMRRVVADDAPGFLGPLAGIATALAHCETPWLLTASVDVPQPPLDLASRLIDAIAQATSPSPTMASVASRCSRCIRRKLANAAKAALERDLAVWRWQDEHRRRRSRFLATTATRSAISTRPTNSGTGRMRGMGNVSASMLGIDEARERVRAVALEHPMRERKRAARRMRRPHSRRRHVSAPFDVPGYVNSAMDGFAVRGADLSADGETRLRLSGEILAGGTQIPRVEAGTCVRITTGAPLPPGADTVVMKENTRVDGDAIVIAPGTAHGANVRPAGEDYANGDAALSRGDVLNPSRIAVLASFGLTHASVSRAAVARFSSRPAMN